MIHDLFPSIGDVVAGAFWLGLAIVIGREVRAQHRADRRRDPVEHYLSTRPPTHEPGVGFTILDRPDNR